MQTHQFSRLETWVKRFIQYFFKKNISANRHFHNISHTEFVVAKCNELSEYYKLKGCDKEALTIAAWFHDIGYCVSATEHERYSVDQALKFLSDNSCSTELKNAVENLILSTTYPVSPSSLTQKIICDADMAHLGSPEYFMWSGLLKREVDHFSGNPVTLSQWNKQNILFFQAHQYFTGYANESWAPQKEKNLQELLHEVDTSC